MMEVQSQPGHMYLVRVDHRQPEGSHAHRQFYFQSDLEQGPELQESIDRCLVNIGITFPQSVKVTEVCSMPFNVFQ